MRRIVVGAVATLALCGILTGCGESQDAAGGAAGAAQDAGQAAKDAAGQAGATGQAGLDAAKQQVQGVLQANPITFTTQSADLNAQDVQTLQQVATVLKTTGATATVSTHAGYPDAAKSQELSEQRADAIVKTLTGAGVDPAKVKADATGNTTAQGDEALKVQISVP